MITLPTADDHHPRPIVLALDPSLSSTGYARGAAGASLPITRPHGSVGASEGDRAAQAILGVLTPPRSAAKGIYRLAWIRDRVLELATGADLVVLEGYSYASRGRAIVSLGELGGVLRLALAEMGARVVEVSPNTRAKYATGRGNAGKEEVLASAIRRLGYAGHSHDEADAAWLHALASDAMGAPPVDLPKNHRSAIEAVEWPATTPQRRSAVMKPLLVETPEVGEAS